MIFDAITKTDHLMGSLFFHTLSTVIDLFCINGSRVVCSTLSKGGLVFAGDVGGILGALIAIHVADINLPGAQGINAPPYITN